MRNPPLFMKKTALLCVIVDEGVILMTKKTKMILAWTLAALILALAAILVIKALPDTDREEKSASREEKKGTILFGINAGAAGYGTIADQTDALIQVYTDRSVQVFMMTEDMPQVAAFVLSEEDYRTVETLIATPGLRDLEIEEDWGVCDGNSSYIFFYDEQGEEVQTLGGYFPVNEKFRETYSALWSVLVQYDYYSAVQAFRDEMNAEILG